MGKERCMCGAYDCGLCYPTTHKEFIRQENKEEEHCNFCDIKTAPDKDGDCTDCGNAFESECFEDEDLVRYRNEGREI